MKVNILCDGLIIEPETDFEEQYLNGFKVGQGYLKFGDSPAHLVGLKIVNNKAPNEVLNKAGDNT